MLNLEPSAVGPCHVTHDTTPVAGGSYSTMATPKCSAANMDRAKDLPDLTGAPKEVVQLYHQFCREDGSSRRGGRRHPVHIMHDYIEPFREADIEDCMTETEYVRIHHSHLAEMERLVISLSALRFTRAEIARMIGVSERTIGHRLKDARLHLGAAHSPR